MTAATVAAPFVLTPSKARADDLLDQEVLGLFQASSNTYSATGAGTGTGNYSAYGSLIGPTQSAMSRFLNHPLMPEALNQMQAQLATYGVTELSPEAVNDMCITRGYGSMSLDFYARDPNAALATAADLQTLNNGFALGTLFGNHLDSLNTIATGGGAPAQGVAYFQPKSGSPAFRSALSSNKASSQMSFSSNSESDGPDKVTVGLATGGALIAGGGVLVTGSGIVATGLTAATVVTVPVLMFVGGAILVLAGIALVAYWGYKGMTSLGGGRPRQAPIPGMIPVWPN